MARAQFQKGQRVWVECVGAWSAVEKVNPIWAKGFDEPVKVTYDVGLGREFQSHELMLPAEDMAGGQDLGHWRVMRARNKWQQPEDCINHPIPGTYPVVVTDQADWGGWRVPGAEYDRDPAKIEFQGRLLAASPKLLALAQALMASVAENPEDAPPECLALARRAREILKLVSEVAVPPSESAAQHPATARAA